MLVLYSIAGNDTIDKAAQVTAVKNVYFNKLVLLHAITYTLPYWRSAFPVFQQETNLTIITCPFYGKQYNSLPLKFPVNGGADNLTELVELFP